MRWAGVITICKVHLLLLIDEMCMLICLNQDYSKMGVKGAKIKTYSSWATSLTRATIFFYLI